MTKLFIIVNVDTFFLSHRKDIALRAKDAGYDVTIIAKDTGKGDYIKSVGLRFINLPINKAGTNLKEELKTFRFLFNLYRREKPDIVHHVGLKVVLWGGLAAKLLKVKGVVNAISGLGILFSDERKDSLMTKQIIRLYRFSHRRKELIDIFQNNEDKALFLSNHILTDSQCAMTNGSGVDLKEFDFTEEPKSPPVKVIFTARMVEDKGVLILIEAAKKLEAQYKDKVMFLLCGGLDSNPEGIKESTLRNLCDGTYIQWLGLRDDVLRLLKESHIVAFPSWYREGIPRSLIEATAIGRPIITTHSIGCKETVTDGYNGFLIPIKDSAALAEKLKTLIDDEELRKTFGRNSRIIAEQKFSIEDVIQTHLSIYKQLSNN